ncbi:SseB family protein, partial [Streptomyces sp900105245]
VAVGTAGAADPAVVRAQLGPGRAEGSLALVLDPAAAPAEAARAVAERLAADETLRARLVRGLDLALLPAGTTPPGEPLYVKE